MPRKNDQQRETEAQQRLLSLLQDMAEVRGSGILRVEAEDVLIRGRGRLVTCAVGWLEKEIKIRVSVNGRVILISVGDDVTQITRHEMPVSRLNEACFWIRGFIEGYQC